MQEEKLHGYNQYKSNQVQTADAGKLILMLYEAAISSLDVANSKMSYQSYDVVSKSINKAIDIVTELRLSLDLKVGEIANQLNLLYDYMLTTLQEANVNKDSKKITEVKDMLQELLGSWKVAYQEYSTTNKNQTTKRTADGGLSIVG